jgi:hypothetical protein
MHLAIFQMHTGERNTRIIVNVQPAAGAQCCIAGWQPAERGERKDYVTEDATASGVPLRDTADYQSALRRSLRIQTDFVMQPGVESSARHPWNSGNRQSGVSAGITLQKMRRQAECHSAIQQTISLRYPTTCTLTERKGCGQNGRCLSRNCSPHTPSFLLC